MSVYPRDSLEVKAIEFPQSRVQSAFDLSTVWVSVGVSALQASDWLVVSRAIVLAALESVWCLGFAVTLPRRGSHLRGLVSDRVTLDCLSVCLSVSRTVNIKPESCHF